MLSEHCRMIRRFYTIILFSFILSLCHLLAQDPYYINYDIEEGLPSSEVYDITTDADGLIWLATDRGICAFDGYEFKIFTTKDGLDSNTNLKLEKDKQGRLWFISLKGTLHYFDQGRFYPYKWNDRLKDIENIGWDRNGVMHYYLRNSLKDSTYAIFPDGSKHKYTIDELAKEYTLVEVEDQKFIELEVGYLPDNRILAHLFVTQSRDSSIYYFSQEPYTFSKATRKITLNKVVKGQDKLETLNLGFGNIDCLYTDQKDNVFIGTIERGLIIIPNGDFKQAPRYYFPNLSITNITQDLENNYWISTLHNGVLMVPSFDFQTLNTFSDPLASNRILSISALPNHIFFGISPNTILVADKKNNQQTLAVKAVNFNLVHSKAENGEVRIGTQIFKEKGNPSRINHKATPFKNPNFFTLRNDSLFTLFNHGFRVYSFPVSSSQEGEEPFYPISRLIHVTELDSIIWLASNLGLYRIEHYNYDTLIQETDSILQTRINYIQADQYKNLWLASLGNGVLYKTAQQVFQISTNDGLNSNLINHLLLSNDSTLWVASNKGLNKINFTTDGSQLNIRSIENYTTRDGLLSNYINDLEYWNDYLWVATNKGVNYFSPDAINTTLPPPKVIMKEVAINTEPIDFHNIKAFKHNQNDLYFKFTGISHRRPTLTDFYRYRLKQQSTADEHWFYTNDRSVQYNNLAPGTYEFEVAAQNKFGQWSLHPASYPFTIHPHFTQTWWFQTGLWIVITSIIGLFFYSRNRRLQKESEQEKKLQQVQLKAREAELGSLRNQMNPHFIYNALNSIQNFIYRNDAEKANHYLNRFSRLMRAGLQFTQMPYISLKEELDFLKNYLELEEMRFPDKFNSTITIDPTLSKNHTFLPPLLVQPILENAIKYAFKYVDYKGNITVEFCKMPAQQLLKITIKDNGSGFDINQPNATPNSSFKKSMGLQIVKNQIDLLNSKEEHDLARFHIFNRKNENAKLSGTQVEIILPFKFKANG